MSRYSGGVFEMEGFLGFFEGSDVFLIHAEEVDGGEWCRCGVAHDDMQRVPSGLIDASSSGQKDGKSMSRICFEC